MAPSPATQDKTREFPDYGVHNEFPDDAQKAASWVVSSVKKGEYAHLKAAGNAVREYMDAFDGQAWRTFYDDLFHLLTEWGDKSREMYTHYPLTWDSRLIHQPSRGAYGGFRSMRSKVERVDGGGWTPAYWIVPVSKFTHGERPINITYNAQIVKEARNSITVQVTEESKTSGSIGLSGSKGPVKVEVGHSESYARSRTESESSGQSRSNSNSATFSVQLHDMKRAAIVFAWNYWSPANYPRERGQLELQSVSKIIDWGYKAVTSTSSTPAGPFLGEFLEGEFGERTLKNAALSEVAPYLVYQQQEFAKDLAQLYFARQRF